MVNGWNLDKKAEELQKELRKQDSGTTVAASGNNVNVSNYKGYNVTLNTQTGEVTLADDGTMTLVDSFLTGWGDSANGLGAGSKYDFTNHKFTYSVGYSEDPEMFFYITATKK